MLIKCMEYLDVPRLVECLMRVLESWGRFSHMLRKMQTLAICYLDVAGLALGERKR
jgi:hypothetical protein